MKILKNIKRGNGFDWDWKIIVLVFAVGMISLSAFAWRIYLSDQIAGGYLSYNVPALDPVLKTIDKSQLKKDLSLIEDRQAEFLKNKNKLSHPVDPSL